MNTVCNNMHAVPCVNGTHVHLLVVPSWLCHPWQRATMLISPQVVELPRERPDPALELFWAVPNLRILVVGGDGTVGWILSCLDRIMQEKDEGAATGWQQPPIAMLPLGTGPLDSFQDTLAWLTRAFRHVTVPDNLGNRPA